MAGASSNLPDVIKPVNPAKLKLPPRRAAFSKLYAIYGIGKKAATLAKYSKNTAESQASRLLANVEVCQAIEWHKEKLHKKLTVTAERVLLEVARIAYADPEGYYDENKKLLAIPDMPEDIRRTIIGVDVSTTSLGKGKSERFVTTTKIKAADKLNALGKLAKHLGLFPDRHELTGKDGKDLFTRQVTVEERVLLVDALARMGAEVMPGLLPAPEGDVVDAEVEVGEMPQAEEGEK